MLQTSIKNPSYIFLPPESEFPKVSNDKLKSSNSKPHLFARESSKKFSIRPDDDEKTLLNKMKSPLDIFVPLMNRLLRDAQTSLAISKLSPMLPLIQSIQKDLLLRASEENVLCNDESKIGEFILFKNKHCSCLRI